MCTDSERLSCLHGTTLSPLHLSHIFLSLLQNLSDTRPDLAHVRGASPITRIGVEKDDEKLQLRTVE